MSFVVAESLDACGGDWIEFRIFDAFDEAVANCTARANFGFVYQFGEYRIHGCAKRALILIHWNSAMSDAWGDVPEAGTGYPRNEDGGQLVLYTAGSLIDAAEAAAIEAARAGTIFHGNDRQALAH